MNTVIHSYFTKPTSCIRILHFTMTLLDTIVTTKSNGTMEDKQEPSDAAPGMISDVKNLYQGDPDNRGQSTWVAKYPDDLEEAAENSETARYALLIRNKKCYDGRKKLEIDSIVIQSPLLKEALGSILKDYPGITTGLDRLTFKPPFQPLVHRWKNLVEALKNEQNPETKYTLTCFIRSWRRSLKTTLRQGTTSLHTTSSLMSISG